MFANNSNNPFKQLLTQTLRTLVLTGIFVALLGMAVPASPVSTASANAENACGWQMAPYECGRVNVYAVDAQTGGALTDAKVAAIDQWGNVVYLYAIDDVGHYSGLLRPGAWKIYVSAEGYETFGTTVDVEPATTDEVKAPLMANSRDATDDVTYSPDPVVYHANN
jgi:hypothetical protein